MRIRIARVIVGTLIASLLLSACKKEEKSVANNIVSEIESIEQFDEEQTLQVQKDLYEIDLEGEEFEQEEISIGDAYAELGYEMEESEEGFSLSTLKRELNEGAITEHEYHSYMVALAYDPDYFIEEYGEKLRQESYDPSASLQWLIDHQDELDERETKMLEEALLPEESFDFLDELSPEESGSIFDLFLPVHTVNAEEKQHDYTLVYPVGFSRVSAILYYKDEVLASKVELTKSLINLACYKYSAILEDYKKGCIYFNITDNIPAVVGAQVYEFEDKVVMQVSNKLQAENYVGVFLEKLFYIYGSPLFTTNNLKTEWLRQATSVWAIDHVWPDLNYEHRYIPHIYTSIFDSYYLISLDGVKSWYQYFLYVTRVLGNEGYVKDLYYDILAHPNDYDMNRILSAGIDEAGLREYMAKFGMCLTGGDSYTGKLSHVDSITQYVFLPDESISATEIKEKSLSNWIDVGLYQGDYHHVFFSTNGLEEKGLNIINNMGAEISKKRGMVIGLTKNDQTEWIMTPENEMPLYHIDFKDTPADYVHILIFNSDMMEVNTYQYALGQEAPMEGTGSIKVTYSKETNLDNAYFLEEVSWESDESLEKIEFDASNDMSGLWKTMIGDSYMVKEIATDYRYKKEVKDEESGFEEITEASGVYFYNSTEEATTTNPLESLLPDLAGLTDQINVANEMLQGLPGVDFGDMGLSEEDLDIIDNGFDAEALGLSDEEMMVFEELMRATKGVQRIRYDSSINSLMLYPALPKDILSEEWIEGTVVTKERNSEGVLVTTSDEITMNPTILFPQWFYNPDEEEQGDVSVPDMSALENYSAYADIDIQEILDQIKGISSTGNAVNVMTLNGKGNIEVDLGGPGQGGALIESVQFDGQNLSAVLSWIDIADDTTLKCAVELNYIFQ